MITGFDSAIERVIGSEGGYVNNPLDPGGETRWGISKRSYPNIDIRNLTREHAKQIYQHDFWLRGQMDKLPPAVAYQTLDIAVNSGIETAIRMLQRAADVADDGHLGPVSLAAINSKDQADIIVRLVAERLDFWRKLTTWNTFGRGWAGRAADTLRHAAEDT